MWPARPAARRACAGRAAPVGRRRAGPASGGDGGAGGAEVDGGPRRRAPVRPPADPAAAEPRPRAACVQRCESRGRVLPRARAARSLARSLGHQTVARALRFGPPEPGRIGKPTERAGETRSEKAGRCWLASSCLWCLLELGRPESSSGSEEENDWSEMGTPAAF